MGVSGSFFSLFFSFFFSFLYISLIYLTGGTSFYLEYGSASLAIIPMFSFLFFFFIISTDRSQIMGGAWIRLCHIHVFGVTILIRIRMCARARLEL